MHTHRCVHIYIYIYIYMCTHIYVYVDTHVYIHTGVHIYTHVRICTRRSAHVHTRVHTYTQVCTHIRIQTQEWIHTRRCASVHPGAHMNTQACIYTHMSSSTHTCACTRKHPPRHRDILTGATNRPNHRLPCEVVRAPCAPPTGQMTVSRVRVCVRHMRHQQAKSPFAG